MPNILDYLTWRGDVPFSVSPPNEVDNYINCKIGTLDFTGIVPENELYVPLPQAVEAYFAAGGAEKLGALSSPYIAPMVKRLPETVRFREVMLTGFRQVYDEKKTEQFSALTLRLPGGQHYVTFRGTDDTIVGWKEDCLLTVMDEIPAQRDAVEYLTWAASVYPGKIAVGGHSKGGNLAMYAAAMVPESVQERIGNIYNNDGPGFQEKILQTEGYRRIKPRIKTILSQNAMVGTLLWNDCDYTVVKSTAALLGAHDGFTWETTLRKPVAVGAGVRPRDGGSSRRHEHGRAAGIHRGVFRHAHGHRRRNAQRSFRADAARNAALCPRRAPRAEPAQNGQRDARSHGQGLRCRAELEPQPSEAPGQPPPAQKRAEGKGRINKNPSAERSSADGFLTDCCVGHALVPGKMGQNLG